MSDRNRTIIEEFRAGEGRVGGRFEGMPMIVIHHGGATTGTEHVGMRTFPVAAEEVTGEERDRIWQRVATERPGFAEYQRNTGRKILVLRLTPAA